MTHDERLKSLIDRHWTCGHPSRICQAYDTTGKKIRPSVYCEGTINGVAAQIYLSIEDGYVMRLGTTDDFVFEQFVELLDGKAVEAAKPAAGQRSLWEDGIE